jgi:hypothetical protein
VKLAPWQREVVASLVFANVWTLFYYFCLRTPIPSGWSLRTWIWASTAASGVAGALCRMASHRAWSVAAGSALGIVLGGGRAYVTDTFISAGQQLWRGLTAVGPYPIFMWAATTCGWAAADMAVRLRRRKAAR